MFIFKPNTGCDSSDLIGLERLVSFVVIGSIFIVYIWSRSIRFCSSLCQKGHVQKFVVYLQFVTNLKHTKSCLDVEREEKQRERQRADHPGQDFSFQWEESTVFSEKATTLSELELVPPCTSPPFLNTWLLKCWNWQETLHETTRRRESSPVTYSSPSATMKSWTNSCLVSPSHREVFCQTSKLSFCQRRVARQPSKCLSSRQLKLKRPFLGPLN